MRQLGRRFAERSPALAPFLGQVGRDPDVERLLEGFDFLTGQLRLKLDEELPEPVSYTHMTPPQNSPMTDRAARGILKNKIDIETTLQENKPIKTKHKN
ncbi:type VI secretion system baseplate subunit TssF, partial [Enterobacter hormaechei]|uniref:type VI secretion system baseplate subunit TssF n=1 Tax=Enterobacter hormaechei TaxID=158836 RepID=UPI0012601C0C